MNSKLPWGAVAQRRRLLCLALVLSGVSCCVKGAQGQPYSDEPLSKSDIQFLREAAEIGTVQAQSRLGLAYMGGDGVPRDQVKACYWLKKAAAQGEKSAETALAVEYAKGDGVPKSEKEAFHWYQQAAQQGFAVAQDELGVFYANGTVVKKDLVEAYKWFNLAAGQGYDPATGHMGAIAPYLTADQIYEGFKRSQAFTPVHVAVTNQEAYAGPFPEPGTTNIVEEEVRQGVSYFTSLATNRMGAEDGRVAAQWLATTQTNILTALTNSALAEMQSAGKFLTALKKGGHLPGVSKEGHGTVTTGSLPMSAFGEAAYPFAVTFNFVATDDSLTNHYNVMRRSPGAAWQLEKAWRTDAQGNTVAEWPVK